MVEHKTPVRQETARDRPTLLIDLNLERCVVLKKRKLFLNTLFFRYASILNRFSLLQNL